MFVALSRFTIANDKAQAVREAFVSRPTLSITRPDSSGCRL